jgi:hypothetical protein
MNSPILIHFVNLITVSKTPSQKKSAMEDVSVRRKGLNNSRSHERYSSKYANVKKC